MALVVRNNPGKTIAQILSRPDVQQALEWPFENATNATLEAIRSAWDHGEALGGESANHDLLRIGANPVPSEGAAESILEALLSDARRNGEAAGGRFERTLRESDMISARILAALLRSGRELMRRATAGVTAAETAAHTSAKERTLWAAAAASGEPLRKMWVARFGPGTCANCAALHGTVRPLGATFPTRLRLGGGSSPGAYGRLTGPPRHPHCRCVVVLYRPGLTGQSPTAMSEYARSWWESQRRRR